MTTTVLAQAVVMSSLFWLSCSKADSTPPNQDLSELDEDASVPANPVTSAEDGGRSVGEDGGPRLGGACQGGTGNPPPSHAIGSLYCLDSSLPEHDYYTANCNADSDCPDPGRCTGGRCQVPCTTDTECEPPTRCSVVAVNQVRYCKTTLICPFSPEPGASCFFTGDIGPCSYGTTLCTCESDGPQAETWHCTGSDAG